MVLEKWLNVEYLPVLTDYMVNYYMDDVDRNHEMSGPQKVEGNGGDSAYDE